MKNHSPWLTQLRNNRTPKVLQDDVTSNVAIIGAGIAGISTAFFVLKNTDKTVALLEKYKLAHGATGHNAGQVVSYFERGFASLVDEFGLELASEGQQSIEDTWKLIDEMYTDAGLNIPFSRFLGHAGLSNYDQILLHLKNNLLRKEGGLNTEQILISDSAEFIRDIPEEYKDLYSLVSHEQILSMLETEEKSFVAVLSYQKGCVNSALFCEEVLLYLLEKYSDRFEFYEYTAIEKIALHHDMAILDAGNHTVTCEKVVMCTNGFEGLSIFNETGLDINTKFHHLVYGTVGYMSGYLEKMNKPPVAISYLTNPSTNDPYFYLTRRMYEYENNTNYNLISIGGPEVSMEDSQLYSRDAEFPDDMAQMIDTFVKSTYDTDPNKKIDYIFTWHGLMGYTKNGIRLIGPEPKNHVLLYNLGCNGVGILPSIYGGKRVSDIISEVHVPPSIFDVPPEYTHT